MGEDGVERILCGGHGMCRGLVGVGMMRESLMEGPSVWRAEVRGGKVQDDAGEAVGTRTCRAF